MVCKSTNSKSDLKTKPNSFTTNWYDSFLGAETPRISRTFRPALRYIFFVSPCQGSKPWQGETKKDAASIRASNGVLYFIVAIFGGVHRRVICFLLNYFKFVRKNKYIWKTVKTKQTFANLSWFGGICEGLFRPYTSCATLWKICIKLTICFQFQK